MYIKALIQTTLIVKQCGVKSVSTVLRFMRSTCHRYTKPKVRSQWRLSLKIWESFYVEGLLCGSNYVHQRNNRFQLTIFRVFSVKRAFKLPEDQGKQWYRPVKALGVKLVSWNFSASLLAIFFFFNLRGIVHDFVVTFGYALQTKTFFFSHGKHTFWERGRSGQC